MLQQDPLFVGPTRPTVILGVPYEALIAEGLITSLAFMASGSLLYLLVFVPIHAVSYLVCKAEPRAFQLILLWLATKGKNQNRAFWGASSYSPLATQKKKQNKPKKSSEG